MPELASLRIDSKPERKSPFACYTILRTRWSCGAAAGCRHQRTAAMNRQIAIRISLKSSLLCGLCAEPKDMSATVVATVGDEPVEWPKSSE